jgi:hypothetical protein
VSSIVHAAPEKSEVRPLITKKGASSAVVSHSSQNRLECGTQPSLPVKQAGLCSPNPRAASRLLPRHAGTGGMTEGRAAVTEGWTERVDLRESYCSPNTRELSLSWLVAAPFFP